MAESSQHVHPPDKRISPKDRASPTAPLPLLPLRLHPTRPATIVWAAGRYLFAYDTAKKAWELPRNDAHEDVVRCLDALAVPSSEAMRWVSAGDDKKVMVWDETGGSWKVVSSFLHGKKITGVLLDANGLVLFADRFGDVYRWEAKEAAEPVFLLGHLAIITAMVWGGGGRFLITADNHEKIRVNNYPTACAIHAFCLGHTAQITALAAVWEDRILSASADGTLRFWRDDGELLACCELGAPPSCLDVSADGANVAVGCEGQGVRRLAVEGSTLSLQDGVGQGQPQAIRFADASSSAIAFVDRRGHLCIAHGEGAEPNDIFMGEDLTPSVVALSKNSNYLDAGGEKGEGDDDEEAEPAKRRKQA